MRHDMIDISTIGKVGEKHIDAVTLHGPDGLSATVLNYGATLQKLTVPDKSGVTRDVICGYDGLVGYLRADGYQGATIGRFANRIGKSGFDINGIHYALYPNDGENHLHGGQSGFDKKVFDYETFDGSEPAVELTCFSPDGEEGYPGNLELTVRFTLRAGRKLSISYEAATDADTYINLTNHAYFNLNGFASGTILEHQLKLDADRYLPVDSGLIPTGIIASVSGTPFDFRSGKAIGKDLELTEGGYDHCMVFTDRGPGCMKRADLYSRNSGIGMEVYTDQPCLQLYTGNMMNGAVPFKGGYPQTPRHALCLETEHMPDSMHHSDFTNCLLPAGCTFSTVTEYKFYNA